MNLFDTVPQLSDTEAIDWVHRQWGIRPTDCTSLDSERDQNFRIVADDQRQFVLKISNRAEQPEFLEAQNELLRHLSQRVDFTPLSLPNVAGDCVVAYPASEHRFLTRLVSWLPGRPMADCKFVGPQLLQDIATNVADVDNATAGFRHPAFHRSFHWDLARGEQVVQSRLELVKEHLLQRQIGSMLDQFQRHTRPILKDLPQSIIHNDFNDGNIVVSNSANPYDTRMTGLVDFGDAVFSWTVGNLAVAMAYTILYVPDPFPALKTMVGSYHAVRPLSDPEISALYGLICLRLCMSVVISADQSQACPENEYLLVSQQAIQKQLSKLMKHSFRFGEALFRTALRRPANTQAQAVTKWLQANQGQFAFPVNPQQRTERPSASDMLVLDLSVSSDLLPVDVEHIDEAQMTTAIQGAMSAAQATVGIGRYLEPRLLYTSSHFQGADRAEETRTIHLGIDIFADQGTDVVAAFSGTVHYAGVIDKPLDYGGLIILKHTTDQGLPFYTLYGHLDPQTLAACRPLMPVRTGQLIAQLGSASVNGGWTPHVHFQCILDLLDLAHEFPGVAYDSQIEVWKGVSPDPNLMLGLAARCFPPPQPSRQETLAVRQQRIGSNLSIGYREPVKVVRGWKQYLFDESGQRFLDAYNNVPHVGHSHPAVVQAASRQLRLLNTNTRYLHDSINELAQRLTETMPAGLDVCYFVNSASEANELALRLARQFTEAQDMIVLDAAYHGHSTTLIDISPYKHDGPGGQGAPDWVHKVALPDVYRGKYRNPQLASRLYANEVRDTIATLDRGLCGFICESCPSVGGQIMLPKGYLRQVYEAVRQAGGLCLADEVQTAYGRLGSHFYGFEMQQVVPDIVILGKPIGNGFPLAAVVTSRSIADAFDNGMEFFSTFGGNPVACAAGVAVLDVLQQEALQEHARQVGDFLLQGLLELQTNFGLIGDVRGQGFFLGIELVQDRQTRIPAASQADFLCNWCRDRRLFIGTDGPQNNVLKIRPPMCFDMHNARTLLRELSQGLELTR